MKQFIFVFAAVALAGCTMEAQQLDKEWGKAQMAAWDSMIANPQPQHVGSAPTGLEGINAEGAMDVYNSSFWKESPKAEVFQFGVTSK